MLLPLGLCAPRFARWPLLFRATSGRALGTFRKSVTPLANITEFLCSKDRTAVLGLSILKEQEFKEAAKLDYSQPYLPTLPFSDQ
jgi:hypothetical protein